MRKIVVEYPLTYTFNGEEKETNLVVRGHLSSSAIGAYEFWGQVGYDDGREFFEIDSFWFNRKGMEADEVAAIIAETGVQTREINSFCNEETLQVSEN